MNEKAKTEKKEEKVVIKKKSDSDLLASISRRLTRVVKYLEEIHGADIDGDGKIGFARISTMLLSCVLTVFVGLGVLYAEDIRNYSSGSGLSGTAVLSHDGTEYTWTVDEVVADLTGEVTLSGTADGLTVRGVARIGFTFADMAVGTNGLGVTLPDNAVVKDVYFDVTTALLSTGTTATIAFDLNGTADLLAAVAYTNAGVWDSTGIKAGVPVGTAGTAIKLTAAREIALVIAGHGGFTQGVGTAVVDYDLLPN